MEACACVRTRVYALGLFIYAFYILISSIAPSRGLPYCAQGAHGVQLGPHSTTRALHGAGRSPPQCLCPPGHVVCAPAVRRAPCTHLRGGQHGHGPVRLQLPLVPPLVWCPLRHVHGLRTRRAARVTGGHVHACSACRQPRGCRGLGVLQHAARAAAPPTAATLSSPKPSLSQSMLTAGLAQQQGPEEQGA